MQITQFFNLLYGKINIFLIVERTFPYLLALEFASNIYKFINY